ncbi:MAG: thioredoxin domain-containing protein [Bacteroidota bacterium]
MSNALANELSPYLLQHQHNPVAWYPWGEAAFALAREQDKPIFLSIGYATCHWCHVMEHESFEDAEVAALMNDAFINIKVDREERPDIDQVYMTYCQLSSGQGGWPLTIIMTPDQQPFFSATYLPKSSRFGRVGMLDLVPRVKQLWTEKRDDVLASARQNVAALDQASTWHEAGQGPAPGVLDFAFQQLAEEYDETYGGFREAPKFPSPHQLQFLVRYAHRTGNKTALDMASHTFQQMALGGVFDHVGFGFHRYATDREWLLPHFEKMLYDQAMIVLAAVELYQKNGDSVYREVADQVITYVLRDMTDGAGGFYSAEDADSEGVEGKFYVWPENEIQRLLDEADASLYLSIYNFAAAGNFKEEATGVLTGENIPHLKAALPEALAAYAAANKLPESKLAVQLEAIRVKLFNHREGRIHPLKDDKVLTDWNGLMIAALSRAAVAFSAPQYTAAAEAAAQFLAGTMTTPGGRLHHRFRNGEAGLQANLDDYAFYVAGLLALYEATFDHALLVQALALNEQMITHFYDETNGGFFFTPDDGEQLITRQKEAYDGAMPSGNSIALSNLLHLGRITGNTAYEEKAAALLQYFGAPINRHPSGFTALLAGIDFGEGPAYEIVVVGEKEDPATVKLLEAIQQQYIPNKVLLLKAEEHAEALGQLAPYTAAMQALNGVPTVYVCENYHCNQPVTSVDELLALLEAGNVA